MTRREARAVVAAGAGACLRAAVAAGVAPALGPAASTASTLSLAATHAPVTPVVPERSARRRDAGPGQDGGDAARAVFGEDDDAAARARRGDVTAGERELLAVGESDDRKLGSIVTSGFDVKLRSSRPGTRAARRSREDDLTVAAVHDEADAVGLVGVGAAPLEQRTRRIERAARGIDRAAR